MFRIGPYLPWRLFGVLSLIVAAYVVSLYAGIVPPEIAHVQYAIVLMYLVNAYFAIVAYKSGIEHRLAWILGLLIFGAMLCPVFWIYSSKRQDLPGPDGAENGH